MFECESFRVCMNGTLRTGEISGSSALVESRLDVVVVVVIEVLLFRLSVISDRLCLCLEVKLSSRGFMSGGSREIWRKMTPRYKEKANETRCKAPSMMLKRKVA